MGSRIEHHADLTTPASAAHAALVDRTFLDERLRALGGKDATLLDHSTTGGTTTYTLRQGIDAAHLPSVARTVIKGDLVVERTETWRPDGPAFTGTTTARVAGVPGEIRAHHRLTDTPRGSRWTTTAEVKVRIPLVGGRVEKVIAEEVGKLLAAETDFTTKWLAER